MSLGKTERRILFFTCAGHSLVHIFIHLFTPIQAEMRESFELSDKAFTRWASISLVLFGVGAIPAGWLSDRYGEKPLLVAYYLFSALGLVAVGVATEPWHLGVGFAVVGIGTSIYHPVALALISKGLRAPGKAMGINGLFGSLGTALSPLLAQGLLTITGSWRWAYLGLAVPTMAIGFWMAKVDLGGKRHHDAAQDSVPGKEGGGDGRASRALYSIVSLLLLAMFCGGVYYGLIITKMPDHLAANVGDASDGNNAWTKGWLPFFIFCVGGVSQVIGGHLVESREGRGMYVVILICLTPLMYAVGVTTGGPLVAVACAMAFFLFAVQPVENTVLARCSPPRLRGRLFGLKFVLVFGLGMGLGTWVSGWLTQDYSLTAVFSTAAIFTAAALVFAIAAWRIRAARP